MPEVPLVVEFDATIGVLAVSGPDAKPFLAGIVTSAVERLEPGRARLAALLTPQGKILVDFLAVRGEIHLVVGRRRVYFLGLLLRLGV